MPGSYSDKGVPVSGAPFLFRQLLLGSLLYCCVAQITQAASCAAEHISERVRVIHVYDGDTVKLEDGRRLRIIGINTPETGHHDQATQPYASEAKALLQMLLDTHNRTLHLQAGKQQRDHYGRLLAHAFLEGGDNIAVRLLLQGLATTLVVPPNTWGQSCYQQQEDMARVDARGLWGLDTYRAQEGRSLPLDSRGFRIIRGTVEEVRQSRHQVWLDLQGPLAIHISRKDLVNFEPGYLETLAGSRVEARGWIKAGQGGLQMKVQHPAALARITRSASNKD
jgi:micrococcal nuclease